ncbi:M28 family peptidase [Candidatus Zixiibacteriota bacterium]
MLCFINTTVTYSYEIISNDIINHIEILAHDSLEGREVGETGEWKAAQYIKHIFETGNLLPKGDQNTYFQEFDFIKRIDFGENNSLTVNGVKLKLNEEFQPLKQSASMEYEFNEIIDVDYGLVIPEEDGKYNDYEDLDVSGKAVIIKRFAPSSEDNPHIDFDKYNSITDKIKNATDNKAAAVILYTPEDEDDTLRTIIFGDVYSKNIPIIFLRRKAFEKLQIDLTKPVINSIAGRTELIKTRNTTQNVIGFIPGQTDTTIIIGAHYDHLGWGGPTSLYHGDEKMIHNGADDNGSGVAVLLELSRYYSSLRDDLKYSMLFIAFAGEEFGLLGSGNFAKNMTIDSSKVRMMINMDMIGRLNEQKNGLAILGTGTCNEFKNYFDSLVFDDFKLALKESGTGPSDHTPFYNRKIPVLNFFTGAHTDYHKPSDDVDKIDTSGILKVTNLIVDIIDHFDDYNGTLIFQKTKDSGEGKRRSRFSVSLGIIPDYIAEIQGLRVDGVSEDKPGSKAGLMEGDIIIKMGDNIIDDIYDYMNALGKYRKGDSLDINIIRSNDTLTLPVIFN